jgi:dynein heavy chain
MTKQADDLCKAISELQPRGGGLSSGLTLQEKVKRLLDDILEKLPEQFSMLELEDRVGLEDRTPYTNVFLQEVDRMSKLLYEMRRSLVELDMGLRGDLSISEAMETLMDSLFDDKVPARWDALAWPSLRPLGSWLQNMLDRYKQLNEWTGDMNTPKVKARPPPRVRARRLPALCELARARANADICPLHSHTKTSLVARLSLAPGHR